MLKNLCPQVSEINETASNDSRRQNTKVRSQRGTYLQAECCEDFGHHFLPLHFRGETPTAFRTLSGHFALFLGGFVNRDISLLECQPQVKLEFFFLQWPSSFQIPDKDITNIIARYDFTCQLPVRCGI